MSSIAIIYFVTAIASIAIAFLLFNLTKSSGAGAAYDSKKKKRENLIPGVFNDSHAGQNILEEVNEIVGLDSPTQEISKKIVDAFNKELDKRVRLNTEELSKKYETVIKSEKQNEEIAWNKYKRVLSDKEKTEAVIRSIAEGLVVVDAQGKVIMMNPAAEKLLDTSKKDKMGKGLLENLKEEQLVSLVKGTGDKEEREIELVSQRDETKKILRASSAIIENENGQTIGMVSVLSDISKQKELDRLKSNFVANVTHELRTPLVAIDKSITLILSKSAGALSPTQEDFLTIASRNIKRLSILINDLLDLSKLEAGKMEVKFQLVSIAKVIDESVAGLNNWAQTKSIQIEKKIQPDLPEANLDPNRIIQVLNNLIGNAIKFTPNSGKITVEVNLVNKGDEISVSIQDTGVGIAPENIAKIFDKFYQIGERVSTDISGTGIGLSIVKEIIELHKGKVWAESQEGKGAKFIFTLPIKQNQ